MIRQRQTLTHFIDSIDEASFRENGLFFLALKEEGKLFRYNLGPESKGFMLCPSCGCSEPLRNFKAGKKHKRLRPLAGTMDCGNDNPWTKPLAFGHEFHSYCLVIRPTRPFASVESLAFAIQRSLCNTLDIDVSDIGVSWRWSAKKAHKATKTEIILYDNTPGGAGFVKEGYDTWPEIINEALHICSRCTCEMACYDCLKHYGNQSHHEKLNRLGVAGFLTAI